MREEKRGEERRREEEEERWSGGGIPDGSLSFWCRHERRNTYQPSISILRCYG